MRPIAALSLIPMVLVAGSALAAEPTDDAARNHWRQLPSLPDPVGYGGMFAGVLNGRLVAGGGSQFRDKPKWLGGDKQFSDRIFTLQSTGGPWVEHPRRLPVKVGHFASAATEDAIYLAGGVSESGCRHEVWRITARGDDFEFTRLADLPHPVGYAAAEIVGGRLYVVGGIAAPDSKSAGTETWSLAIEPIDAAAQWQRHDDMPGPGVHVAAAAKFGDDLYLLGGIGFDDSGTPRPSKSFYCFDTLSGTWEQLSDLPEPRVGPASPCPVIDGRILVIGGYATVFPGPPREHPGFAAKTLLYDLTRNSWRPGPLLPTTPAADRDAPGDSGPAPMIAAPCCFWRDQVVVVGGEVRASVRTPSVLALPLNAVSSDAP
ncbi:MAG: kelch repeat-containing protein [Pirellulales bacterium]